MKKGSLKTPTQSRHFQSRSGLLNQTGGTYSHGGMMVYPRIFCYGMESCEISWLCGISNWKINFRIEGCLRTAYLHVTIIWIKEVEIAKSIDELLILRSFPRQPNFLGFDGFDAMIASALKKLLNTQSNFWKRIPVDEQRAQTSDRFLRGRQIAYMIYEYFRATGAYEAIKGLEDGIMHH